MMDEVSHYNLTRWNALVNANALFTRPYLQLDDESARYRADPAGRFGDVRGKDVLCLASGGGQQSAAFAWLGANVTVFDLSSEQLRRDQEAAAHYGFTIHTVQGDMRDLSALGVAAFDLVTHPYSINFVPDAQMVFRQVGRVLRSGGTYQFNCANPFFVGLGEKDWNGVGYNLQQPYQEGGEVFTPDPAWVHDASEAIPVVREFRHTLSSLVNGLIAEGFAIQHLEDCADVYPDITAEPGSWSHFVAIAPPWLRFWTVYR